MKLYELIHEEYLDNDKENIACALIVETDEIAKEYGHPYNGEPTNWRGVDGRICDIPAYVGGYEVKDYYYSVNLFHERKLFVTI